jgi:ubiquinone/menaquinone biosynthesis C-methylase UbiE
MKKLNFGAGADIREGFDNVDKEQFDFNRFPYPIKDNTYDYILVNHVLEHLEDTEKVLNELCRISKNNGEIEIVVPHVNSEGAFAELGHIRFFAEKTFESYANPPSWRKQPFKVEIISLKSKASNIGKWAFPSWRRNLSLIFNGILEIIEVKFKVIKE